MWFPRRSGSDDSGDSDDSDDADALYDWQRGRRTLARTGARSRLFPWGHGPEDEETIRRPRYAEPRPSGADIFERNPPVLAGFPGPSSPSPDPRTLRVFARSPSAPSPRRRRDRSTGDPRGTRGVAATLPRTIFAVPTTCVSCRRERRYNVPPAPRCLSPPRKRGRRSAAAKRPRSRIAPRARTRPPAGTRRGTSRPSSASGATRRRVRASRATRTTRARTA